MIRRTLQIIALSACASLLSCGDSGGDDGGASADGTRDEGETFTTELTYHADIKPLYTRYCVQCHSVPAVRGAPSTFRLDAYENTNGFPGVKETISATLVSIENDSMPVGRSLKASEKEKFVEWLKAGGPEGEGEEIIIKPDPPSIAMIAPSSAGTEPDAGIIQVLISAQNFESGGSWSLFYSTEEGATSGGTAIATDLDLGDTAYDWDTTGLDPGTYFLYMRSLAPSGILFAPANGSVLIPDPV